MPTYEYICRTCGHNFEIYQSFTEEGLTICPSCGGELRKVFAAPAISFKGSGFYATDNRKGAKSGGEPTSSESKDAKGSGDKGASSEGGESKAPEKKPETTKKETPKP